MVEALGTVSISEDESTQGGFALIDLGRKISRGSIMFSFRRLNAEPRHLGRDGWQREVCWLEPDHVDQSGPSTIIRVGPTVVDQILELEPIEITIHGEHDALPVVHWPALTPSSRGLVTNVGICLPDQATAAVIEARPPEHTENQSLLEAHVGISPPDGTVTGADGCDVSQGDPVETSIGSGQRLEMPQKQEINKRRWPLGIAVALVLFFAAAGGALLLFLRDPPEPRPPNPAAEEMKRRLKDLTDRRAPAPDFEKIGQDALRYGYCQIARDAFEEADPGQSIGASWQLARSYDPRETDSVYRSCFQPNVSWAVRYYNMGEKKGSDRHRKERLALCMEIAGQVGRDEGLRQICR